MAAKSVKPSLNKHRFSKNDGQSNNAEHHQFHKKYHDRLQNKPRKKTEE